MQDIDDLSTFMGEIEMFISHLKDFGEDCFNDKPIMKAWENVVSSEKMFENLKLHLFAK
jgi:hypothetical protein